MKNLHIDKLKQKDTVVVGLSGGADSVCLAHIMKKSSLNLDVVACHVNHNLRGEESIRDMNFVKDFCKEHGIKLYVKSVDIKAIAMEKSISEEECGRQVRYDFFDEIALLHKKAENKVYIATAHSLSDTCETVIFNMARGTGLKGLCGIPKTRDNIIRPIINMTRADVENYCKQNNLSYVTDSTNLTCDYTRNKIRHIVVSCLKQINPAFEHNMCRMVKVLQDDNDCLEGMAKIEFDKAFCEDKLKLEMVYDLHKSIKARLVKNYLEIMQIPVSNKLIESILIFIDDKKGKIKVGSNLYIVVENDMIKTCKELEKTDFFKIELKDGFYESKTGIMYKIQTLETNEIKIINKIYKNLFDISLDCGKIFGSIFLRQRLNGDSIKLATHTKTLKKLFNEKHISIEKRDKLFVLEDEKGIIAIEGIAVANRVECDASTKKVLNIKSIPTIIENSTSGTNINE